MCSGESPKSVLVVVQCMYMYISLFYTENIVANHMYSHISLLSVNWKDRLETIS